MAKLKNRLFTLTITRNKTKYSKLDSYIDVLIGLLNDIKKEEKKVDCDPDEQEETINEILTIYNKHSKTINVLAKRIPNREDK